MSFRNTVTTYGSVAKLFHWLIFLLLLGMIIFGFCLSSIPKDYQGVAYNAHKLTGLSILGLMILRLLWAFANPKPMLPPSTPRWEHWAEWTVHGLLYLAVIAMPIAGWVGASAAAKPPHIGSFQLALPIANNKTLVDDAFTVHNTLALVIIALFCIHFLAALYHHFVRKDEILRRILPQQSQY